MNKKYIFGGVIITLTILLGIYWSFRQYNKEMDVDTSDLVVEEVVETGSQDIDKYFFKKLNENRTGLYLSNCKIEQVKFPNEGQVPFLSCPPEYIESPVWAYGALSVMCHTKSDFGVMGLRYEQGSAHRIIFDVKTTEIILPYVSYKDSDNQIGYLGYFLKNYRNDTIFFSDSIDLSNPCNI